MGDWLESMCAWVTRSSCLISLICSAWEGQTPSQSVLIVHSMATCCPGDVPVIGRTTEVSIGRGNCSLQRKLLWSALTSRPFPNSTAETESLLSPLIYEIQVRSRGLDEPLFELPMMRPDGQG